MWNAVWRRCWIALAVAAAFAACGDGASNPDSGEGAGKGAGTATTTATGGAGANDIGGINWAGGYTATGGGTGSGTGTPSGIPSCDGVFDEVSLDCASYCQLMDGHCFNGQGHFNDQYPGGAPDVCEAACGHMALGSTSDPTGNTVACRIERACMSEWESDAHCTEAGPGGDGICGSACESFCSLALSICDGAQAQWTSQGECETQCAAFDFSDGYNTTSDNWTGTVNAYACRMYWLMMSLEDPLANCKNAKLGASTPDPCVDGI